ncbi:MAG: hypothetical protein ACO1PZ_07480, partial [Gammaproteobacteria bacterium]
MTQQLSRQQIAWRVAQDLPRGIHVMLGPGMPLLVPGHVADGGGIVFECASFPADAQEEARTAQRFDYYVVGAREVAPNGDLLACEASEKDTSLRIPAAGNCAAGAAPVFVMTEYFAPDGRPVLVPQCSMPPCCERCVTRLYTDIAVLDLHGGKAWLREIIEGITLHVLQAE